MFTSTATYEKFINTTNAPPFLENATIRPERANYYLHAGVTQQIIPGFKVGLDGYYKQAEDLLDDGQFGAPVFLTPLTTRRRRIWASS